MTSPGPRTLTIIAGPNGSGKSTLTESLRVRGTIPVLDADAIARGLRPDAPALVAPTAGRLMIQRENDYLARGVSFAIETTLAGERVLRLMRRARQVGYDISLIYVGVDRVETVLGRIEERVSRGDTMYPRSMCVAAMSGVYATYVRPWKDLIALS